MKPIASTMTEVDNLPGEEIKFSISEANAGWVMRSMADLYSNRELAVIREYSTNAYDSNVEAAIKGGYDPVPIQVTLPSAMNPYFTVQDFGVGMSEQELREVYTQFGNSTKRDSDDFNGMLGFGSKSAVAYTNTFTITAVKNGKKTVAVVTRKEDYSIVLKIVMAVDTTEGNGVTIQVPVHNWREFVTKAEDFYRFWLPGRVLLNGREPKWAVGDKIAENLFMSTQQGTSYVVMGNVAYRIINAEALFPRGMNRVSFVAYVPNGAIEFTPSREDLKYSEHTKKNLKKVITDFVDTAISSAKADIAKATTHAEAYAAWKKWTAVVGSSNVADLTFKGDKLEDTFKIKAQRYQITAYRYSTYAVEYWTVSEVNRTIIVTGFVSDLNSTHKTKVKEWMQSKGITASWILFTQEDKVTSPWVDPSRVVTWEKVKAEAPKKARPPRAANPAWGRKAGSFDLITKNGRKREQDVPQSKELFYVLSQEFNAGEKRGTGLSDILKGLNMDDEVVLLPLNRKDKFLRHYPHAKPIMPVVESKVNLDGPSLISADGMVVLKTNHNEARLLAHLDDTMVDDPELKTLIKLHKVGREAYLKDYANAYRLASLVGKHSQFKRHQYESYWDCKYTPLADKYPLVGNISVNHKKSAKHAYIYINALYKARKEGKNV